MGSVYRARDSHLNRVVALKIMKRSLAQQPEFQQRFLQEAQAAARLKHPSIVQIYHFGNRQGLFYMAMAFVPGATLGVYVRRLQEAHQVIRLSESLALLAQVAEALGYAHRQGVVHRDVKPDNVLLEPLEQPDREGDPPIRAVVTDFGLAKLLEGGVETQTGTFLGTMPYMSPEQCRGRHIDGRSDIYSLGILLFQLATGHLPFDIRTPAEAAEKHIRETPPLPHKIRPGLPAALEAIILKAIAKQPDERFQTGEELARVLREQARLGAPAIETNAPESEAAGVAATAVVSLVTQLMPELSQLEPPAVDSNLVAPTDTDYLIIQRQGAADQTVTLAQTKLTIGRSKENDIVLDAPGVSRQHARLERTTSGWQLLDTGSSNGTFVKSSQLLPNIPEPWEPGQVARLGPYFIRWQPAAGTAVAQWSHTIRAGQSGVTQILSMDGQLGIMVNPTHTDVTPGGRAEVQVELFNQGVLVDHFELRLAGLPAEWITLTPEPVQLMPGGHAALPFTIHPPRDSSARAGRHPYELNIFSASTKQKVATINGSVTVAPFARFVVEAQPTQLVNRGVCRVTIHNQGNSPATVGVQARDTANALLFSGEQSALTIPSGQVAEALLGVQPKTRPFTGRVRAYSFQVQVQTSTTDSERKQGVIEVRPRFPSWAVALVPVMGLLLCLSLALGGRAYLGYNVGMQQTATAVAAQTAAAQGTAVAQANSDAQATLAANDDDGDGLSNQAEAQLGTNPANPDTDGDGLLDGEEQMWGANPLVFDSDGDTLSDGREVHEIGSSPINPDTDGDGLPDNVDPDPGQLPTPTPLPTNTPPPSATPPPTAPPQDTATPLPTDTPSPTPTPTIPILIVTLVPTPDIPIENPDCITYNPENLTIVDEGANGWLLSDGTSRMKLLDNQADAQKALALAQRHTLQCFIGRGNTRSNRASYIVQYWAGDSGLNTLIANEDCINYNENTLSIVDLGADGWRLTDGTSAMEILDNADDANDALLLAQAYSEQCFIGRGNTRSNRLSYILQYWK